MPGDRLSQLVISKFIDSARGCLCLPDDLVRSLDCGQFRFRPAWYRGGFQLCDSGGMLRFDLVPCPLEPLTRFLTLDVELLPDFLFDAEDLLEGTLLHRHRAKPGRPVGRTSTDVQSWQKV
ncbi:MAG: hypothetical protein WBM03_00885 [Steroidobacteraceae bacterium]